MLLVLLGLLMVGGRRIWHLRYVQSDPILARFAGLRRLPSPRTVSGWLAQLSESHVARLVRLNSEVVGEALQKARLARLTIDVDGSVVSTGQTVEGAKRGFNPHHRKVPSYYPITAYEAQSGQILRVENLAPTSPARDLDPSVPSSCRSAKAATSTARLLNKTLRNGAPRVVQLGVVQNFAYRGGRRRALPQLVFSGSVGLFWRVQGGGLSSRLSLAP